MRGLLAGVFQGTTERNRVLILKGLGLVLVTMSKSSTLRNASSRSFVTRYYYYYYYFSESKVRSKDLSAEIVNLLPEFMLPAPINYTALHSAAIVYTNKEQNDCLFEK